MFVRSTTAPLITAIALTLPLLLTGCDLAQLLADPKIAQREADSKAVGGACRHGLRSIEDCYSLNERASRAAVFAGWKEMDQYMRDNKIEGVVPQGLKPQARSVIDEEVVLEDPKVTSKSKDPVKDLAKSAAK